MLKSITVFNHKNESLEMVLANPRTSGFFIKSVDGLGPPKASINTTPLATSDGEKFNSARVGMRNIVLTLAFTEDPTIEHVRQRSYRFFPLKKYVTLLVTADNRIGRIQGYVEANEPDIFSSESGTQISIICPDPFFTAMDDFSYNTIRFWDIAPEMEFPFENESLTEKLLEVGSLTLTQTKTFEYMGDADVGMLIKATFDGPVENFRVFNPYSSDLILVDHAKLAAITGSGFVAGDVLTVQTRLGIKAALLIRNGVSINILNALGRDIRWPTLQAGFNTLEYSATSGVGNVQLALEFYTLYEGI